ncbi:hypothetical protein NJC40_03770 [Pseudomonas sp. 21LCFQ02]|uniref:hypothetical protein n=1 Tax=Pseudomonas sp. 21LCFQ02 TaxID=2957505 RepID=UPI00209B34DA|nr:hypothetical protein [Pseudomonas sp. 21LCFQ02]MCO8166897.1 hypothetical protein [Pseudomonas sp. 21LCFQ02]
MSLFQCYACGCRENTATSNFALRRVAGQWRGVPSLPWMLCSACDPDIGRWHGEFERVFLPKGEFCTNAQGNLEHIVTAQTFKQYLEGVQP